MLPDPPARTKAAPPTPKIASVPIERSDTDPDVDDATGSILQPPPATILIDIGESSSIELPLAEPEEQPPVIRTPQLRSRNESRLKGISRVRRARALVKPKAPAQFDLFKAMFGEQKFTLPPTVGTNTVAP